MKAENQPQKVQQWMWEYIKSRAVLQWALYLIFNMLRRKLKEVFVIAQHYLHFLSQIMKSEKKLKARAFMFVGVRRRPDAEPEKRLRIFA